MITVSRASRTGSEPSNVILVREKLTLVNAVSSLSTASRREAARRFLEGLSGDELEYIAAYFGARLIESRPISPALTRDEIALCIQRYDRVAGPPSSAARSTHRMMILLEYLSMNRASQRATVLAPAGAA